MSAHIWAGLATVYAAGFLSVGWIAMGVYLIENEDSADVLSAAAIWALWPITIPAALLLGLFRLWMRAVDGLANG